MQHAVLATCRARRGVVAYVAVAFLLVRWRTPLNKRSLTIPSSTIAPSKYEASASIGLSSQVKRHSTMYRLESCIALLARLCGSLPFPLEILSFNVFLTESQRCLLTINPLVKHAVDAHNTLRIGPDIVVATENHTIIIKIVNRNLNEKQGKHQAPVDLTATMQ